MNKNIFFCGQVDERRETELKKRGLCLVPFSMIINYMDQ